MWKEKEKERLNQREKENRWKKRKKDIYREGNVWKTSAI